MYIHSHYPKTNHIHIQHGCKINHTSSELGLIYTSRVPKGQAMRCCDPVPLKLFITIIQM